MLIQYIKNIEPNSLFIVNAISLAAFAIAFFGIWIKQRSKTYWLYWTVANLILSAALLSFVVIDRSRIVQMAFVNCLLVLGLTLRWQALRSFFNRKNYIEFNLLALLVVVVPYLLAPYVKHGLIFGAVNVVLLAEVALIIRELVKPDKEKLPSRWGLVVAYGLIGGAFSLRILQGWFISFNEMTPLPSDYLLTAQLLVVSIHIVASGAFAISIAYERGIFELQQMTLRDPLTELYNRRAYEMTLAQLKPEDGDFALILLDIDHFKRINDQFGHEAGDIALKRCARILTGIFRKADFIARIGGEEFVVILPETTIKEAYEFAEHVRRTVENDAFAYGEGVVRLTISAGVCQASSGLTSFADISKKADVSLYEAKNKGRNRVETFAV